MSPKVVILMGVSGAGKTTIGRLLAAALNADYAEGDSYHPAANVEKMRAGQPLADADRWPWLDRLASEIGRWLDGDRPVVLACSALKAAYRDRLIGGRPSIALIHLRADEPVIRARLDARQGHYMPPSLLTSQFAALEEPAEAITIDARKSPAEIVAEIQEHLNAGDPSKAPSVAPTR